MTADRDAAGPRRLIVARRHRIGWNTASSARSRRTQHEIAPKPQHNRDENDRAVLTHEAVDFFEEAPKEIHARPRNIWSIKTVVTPPTLSSGILTFLFTDISLREVNA